MGSHIFQKPKCSDYHLAYGDGTNTLWQSFDWIILEENHRQGEDYQFANLLNRIREGKQSKEDLELLKSRVRPTNHLDIITGNSKICSTREEATLFNEKKLNELPGTLHSINATHFCKSKKNTIQL